MLVLVGLLVAVPEAALADEVSCTGAFCGESGSKAEGSADGGTISTAVSAGDIPVLAPGTGGRDLFAGCSFFVDLTGLEVIEMAGGRGAGLDFTRAELGDLDARFVWAVCPNPVFFGERSALWEVGDPVPDVIVEALVDAAVAATDVPFPVPQSSPDGADILMLVNLPTWLWIDDGAWQPVAATAAIPEFGLSATVTATPYETIWDPGNGDEPVVCGQGVVWVPGASDDETDCSIVYTDTTANTGPIVLRVETWWDLELSCVPAAICATADPLGDFATSIGREVEVTQVRGVLTR